MGEGEEESGEAVDGGIESGRRGMLCGEGDDEEDEYRLESESAPGAGREGRAGAAVRGRGAVGGG